MLSEYREKWEKLSKDQAKLDPTLRDLMNKKIQFEKAAQKRASQYAKLADGYTYEELEMCVSTINC